MVNVTSQLHSVFTIYFQFLGLKWSSSGSLIPSFRLELRSRSPTASSIFLSGITKLIQSPPIPFMKWCHWEWQRMYWTFKNLRTCKSCFTDEPCAAFDFTNSVNMRKDLFLRSRGKDLSASTLLTFLCSYRRPASWIVDRMSGRMFGMNFKLFSYSSSPSSSFYSPWWFGKLFYIWIFQSWTWWHNIWYFLLYMQFCLGHFFKLDVFSVW